MHVLNHTIQSTGFDDMEMGSLASGDIGVEDYPDDMSIQKEPVIGIHKKELEDKNAESSQQRTCLGTEFLSTENSPVKMALEPAKSKAIAHASMETPISVVGLSIDEECDNSVNKIADKSNVDKRFDEVVVNGLTAEISESVEAAINNAQNEPMSENCSDGKCFSIDL